MYFAAGAPSFVGPIDLGGAAKVAYSVGRKLSATYSGAVIRVRRSSDSTEQDFYAGSDGAVSTAAVAAFCGAGDGFVTTLYDQSGNGYHLTQATSTRQPRVCLSGVANTKNGKLAQYHVRLSAYSVNRGALEAYFTYLHDSAKHSYLLVNEVANDAASKILLGTRNAALDRSFQIQFSSSELMIFYIENGTGTCVTSSKTGSASSYNTVFGLLDANNATAADREFTWRDGTLMTGSNANTAATSSGNPARPFIIGANSSGSTSNAYEGNFCEFVSWSSDISSLRTTLEANSKAFWGTP
jgi:hypothetical protein